MSQPSTKIESSSNPADVRHPLHPPTASEITLVGQLVKEHFKEPVVFASVALVEPNKADVKAFDQAGDGAIGERRIGLTALTQRQGRVLTVWSTLARTLSNLWSIWPKVIRPSTLPTWWK